jgi:flagellar assembly protein FliH
MLIKDYQAGKCKMTYQSSKEIAEARRIFKSAPVKSIEKSIPNANEENIASSKAVDILNKAQINADLTLKKANDQSQAIMDKSRQDGFAKGQTEAKQKYDPLLKSIQKLVIDLDQIKTEVRENLRETIIALSIEIAAKTIKKQIELDPMVVAELAFDVLSEISPAKEIVLRLNPLDFEALKDVHRDFESTAGYPSKFKVTPDASLHRGDVVVNYERGTLDARITTQLRNIAEELMAAAL